MRHGGSLPADLTSLVGRAREVREVRAMLGRARLVSLTGPGGVGKTRVALAAARTAERAFSDGVWLVEFGALRDPALVEATVTAALSEEHGNGSAPLPELIQNWHALLLLDNCEHLLPACARLIRDVLQRAPMVRILTTSREPIGISGEHVLRIGPLDVPDEAAVSSVDALLDRYESVQLLRARAQAIQPDFEITPTNATAVARLCRRLDGLPLTIELAAARLNTMSIRQIADRLDNSAAILTTAARDAPSRHASLDDTITWSYELCSPSEQRLWARMSVFAGDVDADAIVEVCGDPDGDEDILDLLDGLVRKSIVVHEQGEVPRFSLLGTIRQYGRRRLDPVADAGLAARHSAYYERMANAAADAWYGPDQLVQADRLRHALPDLRLALDHALHGPRPERGLDMAARLFTLWVCQGRFSEGNLWLERGLAVAPPGAEPLARALTVQGWIQLASGGQVDEARATLNRAIALATERGQPDIRDYAAALLSVADGFQGRHDEAIRACSAAAERRRSAGDDAAVAVFGMFLAEMRCATGEFDLALTASAESEALSRKLGEVWCRSYALWISAHALCVRGEHERAAEVARSSVEMKIALDDTPGMLLACEVLCWSLAGAGRWIGAGRLYAAIQPRGDRFTTPLRAFGFLAAQREKWVPLICEQLGPDGYRAAEKAGVAMSLEEIGEYALATRTPPGRAARTTAPVPARAPLTRRETEVAGLVAAGLTNRQIAGRLVISPRTAEVHVERILVKLGFRSRGQVAPWWNQSA